MLMRLQKQCRPAAADTIEKRGRFATPNLGRTTDEAEEETMHLGSWNSPKTIWSWGISQVGEGVGQSRRPFQRIHVLPNVSQPVCRNLDTCSTEDHKDYNPLAKAHLCSWKTRCVCDVYIVLSNGFKLQNLCTFRRHGIKFSASKFHAETKDVSAW